MPSATSARWASALRGIVDESHLYNVAAPAKDKGAIRIPAEDRLDIIELMTRYAWAYDTDMEEALAAIFTPDGGLEVPGKPLNIWMADFAAFMQSF